jgi:hypothetical protein
VSTRAWTVMRARARRRTPWGAPWWVYAVAIGAANIARQVVMPDDVSTGVQVGTFVALVVGVAVLVTLVHIGLARWRRRWPRTASRSNQPG